MEYTGKWWTRYSDDFGQEVNILEYKDKKNKFIPYCDCTRCGKPIKSHMFVIQDTVDDVEMAYYGADCIKHLK